MDDKAMVWIFDWVKRGGACFLTMHKMPDKKHVR